MRLISQDGKMSFDSEKDATEEFYRLINIDPDDRVSVKIKAQGVKTHEHSYDGDIHCSSTD